MNNLYFQNIRSQDIFLEILIEKKINTNIKKVINKKKL